MPGVKLSVKIERWPLRDAFVIARGSKTEARIVVATLDDGTFQGRGECVPYARYGETVDEVAETMPGSGQWRRARNSWRHYRQAPRAMRLIARYGILRPSAAAAAWQRWLA